MWLASQGRDLDAYLADEVDKLLKDLNLEEA